MTTVALDERGLPVGYPFHAELEVTPREVKDQLASGQVYLVDCRTPAEAAVAKIDGAVLIPLDVLASKADEIEAVAGDTPIVVHCHMGGRSMKAALFLRSRGVEARSMAGGIDAWALAVDPAVPRY